MRAHTSELVPTLGWDSELRALGFAVSALGVTLVAVDTEHGAFTRSGPNALVGLVAVTTSLLAILLLRRPNSPHRWPIIGTCVAFGYLFGLSTVARSVASENFHALDPLPLVNSVGVAMSFLGMVLISARFPPIRLGVTGPTSTRAERGRPDSAARRGAILILYTAPVMLFIVHLYLLGRGSVFVGLQQHIGGRDTSQYGTGTNQYFSSSAVLHVALAVAAISKSTKRSKLSALLGTWPYLVLPALAFFPQGQRRYLLPAAFLLAFCLRDVYGKYSKKALAVSLMALAIVVAVLPLYRAAGARERTSLTEVVAGVAGAPAGTLRASLLGSDTSMVQSLAHAIDGGIAGRGQLSTLTDPLLAPFPSSIVPYVSGHDRALIILFGERCRAFGGGFCPDFSAPGSFYFDLGVLGALLGGVLWALLLRGVAGVLFSACRLPFVAFGGATVMSMVAFRAGFGEGVVWMLYYTVALIIVATVVGFGRHPNALVRPNPTSSSGDSRDSGVCRRADGVRAP